MCLCIFFPPLIFLLVKFDTENEDQTLNPCHKLYTFYRSPVVKFFSNVLMFAVFLILYSYVILLELKEEIQVAEIVALLWIVTMALEEIREVSVKDDFRIFHCTT